MEPNELYVSLAGPSSVEKPIPALSVDLGGGNFVKLSHYNSKNYLAIRKFDGKKALGGITVPIEHLQIIKKAIGIAEKHVLATFPEMFKN